MPKGQQALGLLKGLDPGPGGWGGGSLGHGRAAHSSVQQLHSLIALHSTRCQGLCREEAACNMHTNWVVSYGQNKKKS